MKWLNKWLANRVKQAQEDQSDLKEDAGFALNSAKISRPVRLRDNDSSLNSRGTSFTLYNANGGTVVELRDYDPMNDRHLNVLYVIPSDQDLGEQLGHIVTMEALKR
jgi:hypothetical protein